MFKGANLRIGSHVKLPSTLNEIRQATSSEKISTSEAPLSRGVVKGLISKTHAFFSIDKRQLSISVEIPESLSAELLEAFAEKLTADFIKNIYDVATLPSNFRTPFLKKWMVREDKCWARAGRALDIQHIRHINPSFFYNSAWPVAMAAESLNTKEPQLSIGLTTSVSFYDRLEKLGSVQNKSVNRKAFELYAQGFSELKSRLRDEDDFLIFCDFEESLSDFRSLPNRRWMLRVDRNVYNKTSLIAQEFGKSLANIAVICIAHSLIGEIKSMENVK